MDALNRQVSSSDNLSPLQQVKMDVDNSEEVVDLKESASDKVWDMILEENYIQHCLYGGKTPDPDMLLTLVAKYDDKIDSKFKFIREAYNILKSNPELDIKIKEAWGKRSFEELRNISYLKAPPVSLTEHPNIQKQIIATNKSWLCQYRGDVAKELWRYIQIHFLNANSQTTYARYTAVVQSSGTGKSRAVDELSKEHFVIPLCLRENDAGGFPPPDSQARDYLLGKLKDYSSQYAGYLRCASFVAALFQEASAAVKEMRQHVSHTLSLPALALKFRHMMTDGQSFKECNEFRKNFYARVVSLALELEKKFAPHLPNDGSRETEKYKIGSPKLDDSESYPPSSQFDDLRTSILSLTSNTSTLELGREEPLVTLAFDEAQTLTQHEHRDSHLFVQLRYVLEDLFPKSLFSLFLSTNGNLSKFVPMRSDDSSNRIVRGELRLIEPFTDLGYDLLAKRAQDGQLTLAEVTKVNHMAKLGRPLFAARCESVPSMEEEIVLFAASKLLNKVSIANRATELSRPQMLACLSQRIPIEFLSTSFVPTKWRPQLVAAETHQVESHLRICLKAERRNETITTVTPSEPLLSEASFLLMQLDGFSAPKALKDILSGSAIAKGDRGELLVLLQAILARDAAILELNRKLGPLWTSPANYHELSLANRVISVDLFLHQLLNTRANTALVDIFKKFNNVKLHYNHFIRVHDREVISNAECLAALLTRGTAVLCANGQPDIDILIPVLLGGFDVVDSKQIAVIAIQVNNDKSFKAKPHWYLCDGMAKWLEKNNGPPAILRIVFALASDKSAIKFEERAVKRSHTEYNIWCAGLTSAVFPQIKEEEQSTWDALLQAYHPWESVYLNGNGSDAPEIPNRASMNPGAAFVKNFWGNWWEFDALTLRDKPGGEIPEELADSEDGGLGG